MENVHNFSFYRLKFNVKDAVYKLCLENLYSSLNDIYSLKR